MKLEAAGYSFEHLESTLYSAVISDILDDFGYNHQTVDPKIVPLNLGIKLFGRAFTVLAAKVFEIPKEPYKLQMEAVDSMKPGEIFAVYTGSVDSAAFWGELLSTACRARGGRGALVDGLSRDTEIGGVTVHPGDLIFGDRDGVVIIPQAIETEVIEKSLEKVSGENLVRKALQDGMLCTEAFKTFGIL
jgi:4-hydroxy-4-methyl-2-oxoglutarate aldolase